MKISRGGGSCPFPAPSIDMNTHKENATRRSCICLRTILHNISANGKRRNGLLGLKGDVGRHVRRGVEAMAALLTLATAVRSKCSKNCALCPCCFALQCVHTMSVQIVILVTFLIVKIMVLFEDMRRWGEHGWAEVLLVLHRGDGGQRGDVEVEGEVRGHPAGGAHRVNGRRSTQGEWKGWVGRKCSEG